MQANQLKKRDERREMLKLMQERERATPDHRAPAWMQAFWITRRQVLT